MPRRPKSVRAQEAQGVRATASKVDLKLLAQHLGLSQTTVSLVLNDAPHAQRLAPQTRERVRQAAEELGYKPNYFARSLSGKRSKMVGVLAPDFGEGYDSVVLGGIESELLSGGYMYFVSSHLWSHDVLKRSLDALVERGAEGLLLLNTPLPGPVGLPAVSIGSPVDDPSMTLVSIDNYHGMHCAFEYLTGLGHRHIAVLKGHEGSSDTEERWHGAIKAAAACGVTLDKRLTVQLERANLLGTGGIEEGYVATETLLARNVPFSALICFNDMSACGAMNALRDAGLGIPEDVSVVGFDDIPVAKIVYPTLTTIRQPLREMGEQAARSLIRRMEEKDARPANICMKPELVVRNSTSAPQRAAMPGASSLRRRSRPSMSSPQAV